MPLKKSSAEHVRTMTFPIKALLFKGFDSRGVRLSIFVVRSDHHSAQSLQ